MRKQRWRNHWPLLIVIVAGMAVLLPVFMYGVPSGADRLNHYRFALTFDHAIRAGRLYPGWLADSNAGYGDPSVRFYPPALYYLMTAARALLGDWYRASIAVFTFISVMGACGAYFWACAYVPRRFAVWAGVFYAIAPFRLNEMLEWFLLAEYAGGVALVFSFGFVERVCRRGRAMDVAGLAISYALLILTHLPLTVMGSLALCVYALVRIEREHVWATLKRLTAGVLLGLAASACYWTTMAVELGWIKAGSVAPQAAYDYRNNFLFSTFSYTANFSVWWANYVAFATLLTFIPALALLRRREVKGLRAVAFTLLGSFLMATAASKPVWVLIPRLQSVQFPFRWLAISSMAGAVLVAASMPVWTNEVRRAKSGGPWRILAMTAAGSVLLSSGFLAIHFATPSFYDDPPKFYAEMQSIPGAEGHKDWWPVWAGDALPRDTDRVEVEGRAVAITSWEAERRAFLISAGSATSARVRTFYYPYWTATAGGRSLDIRPDGDGAILIALPAEAVSVVLEFHEPRRAHLAAALSALGWILIAALFLFGLREMPSPEYDACRTFGRERRLEPLR